ncbi:hypothetical protein KDA00_05685 [Candidatus Saccharibacteria bacterium]|nr:hypothetical protein [Candidatus Saccharibacteria bacterium]
MTGEHREKKWEINSTFNDVIDAYCKMERVIGVYGARPIIREFGANTLAELSPRDWDNFIARAEEIIK